METGESSSSLSAELGVKRAKLYRWRDLVRRDGEKAFPGYGGRRPKAEALARELGAEGATELAQARRKITELERKIDRSTSSSWISIFSSTPCGTSRRHDRGTARVAQRHLRPHRGDDAPARQFGGEGQLQPPLAGMAEPGAAHDADGPEPAVVADITYVRLAEVFVYLTVVLDGFSRKVVGGRWKTT